MMRIIGKECRKIMNMRMLIVIAVFTFLYYQVFMEYAYSLNGWWKKYDFSLREELMEEIGTAITPKELPILYRKREELVEKAEIQFSKNGVLEAAGISNYEELEEIQGKLLEKRIRGEALTEEEQRIDSEIDNLLLRRGSEETTKYLRQIEVLDNLIGTALCQNGCCFSVPPEDAERLVKELYQGYTTPLYIKAKTQFCQRGQSLIPHGVYLDILWPDMMDMARLLVICCCILIVPYQIHERLRGVWPLYASTRTGRRIFGMQFCASLLSCGIMCVIQLLVYLGVFVSRRLGVFWKCPAWSDSVNEFWLPVSFGIYMAIYMLMVWLFGMGSATLAYCMGRWASNYVAGIAMSIPAGGIACYLGTRIFHNLFCFYYYVRVPLWEILALAAWLAVWGALIATVRKRDMRRGIMA